MVAGTVVAALASVPLGAQTSSGPDYSNVSDFLNGQRTLLKVQDLQVVVNAAGYNNSVSIIPITTQNSAEVCSPRKTLSVMQIVEIRSVPSRLICSTKCRP